jgi:hypothetical protein
MLTVGFMPRYSRVNARFGKKLQFYVRDRRGKYQLGFGLIFARKRY